MRERTTINAPFPRLGLIESTALREQPELSCIDIQNMRGFSPSSGRNRGAQRKGLGKYCTAQIAGASGRIQCLNHVVNIQASTEAQTSMQVRSTTPIAVMAGKIRTFSKTASLTPTGVSDPDLLATAPFIMSEVMNQKVWFVDGTNYVTYDPATGSNGTVSAWTAANGGTIPSNGSDTARLIATWNNRIVLSGIKSDPQNVFMSARNDPEDFDYAPSPRVVTQAVAFGTTEDLTKLPEPCMALMVFDSDVMFLGGDHSIYAMTGEPLMGGQVELISDVTGVAFGQSWCKDPSGHLYFFGSRGGVYRIVPGSLPERITANRIEKRLQGINLDTHYVQLVWDDEEMYVKVYVTNLAGDVTDNFIYDTRNDAWFKDVFDDQDHYPCAVHVFDGDDADDRVIWLGGQDGYVRHESSAFLSDDGTAIDSWVAVGPFQADGGNLPFIMTELQAFLGSFSSDITWELAIADTAEDCVFDSGGYWLREDGGRWVLEDGTGFWLLEGTSLSNLAGTFSGTRSVVANPRMRGYAAYVLLRNNTLGESWEMESLRSVLSIITTSRGRI